MAAAAPPADDDRLHKVVAPHFNRLLKALLCEGLFEFDVAMLDEFSVRKKLVSAKSEVVKPQYVNARAQSVRRLMAGDDPRCPDFAERLRRRLDAARAEHEANPPPVAPPEVPPPTNTEPSDMRLGYYYRMEEEGAPIEFSTTNLHCEAYGLLADGDDRTAEFLVNGALIRFLHADEDQTDVALLASLLTSLLVRKDDLYGEFARRSATTKSPEPFKAFIKDIVGKPEFISEQLMQEALASLPQDAAQAGSSASERILKHLRFASGVRVNACQPCKKWWLSSISSFRYNEIAEKQPLQRFPYRRIDHCLWCGDLVDSNDRPHLYSFVVTKKRPRKLCKLSCVISAGYFVKRTLRVCGAAFRAGAATYVTGDGRIYTLVFSKGDDEQDEVVDHARPFAVLSAEQKLLVPKGYVACIFYVKA